MDHINISCAGTVNFKEPESRLFIRQIGWDQDDYERKEDHGL